jgi:hypothetical protein
MIKLKNHADHSGLVAPGNKNLKHLSLYVHNRYTVWHRRRACWQSATESVCTPAGETPMLEAVRLREQAEKARRLARESTDELTSARLTAMAEEYASRAQQLEESQQP